MRTIWLSLLMGPLFAVCADKPLDMSKPVYVTVSTAMGDVTVELYGDTPLLGKNDAAYFVRADHGMNGIFSEFSGKNGKKYLVINGDQKYPELFWIQGNDREKYHVWLPPGGAHIVRD